MMVRPEDLTDEMIDDADRRGVITQPIARIAKRHPASIQRATARQMVVDAINAAKDGQPEEVVTAETITMRQVLEVYWNATDASVVRAAMCVLHGLPMIGSFQEPNEHERDAAAATVAVAWNALAAARSEK